MRTNNITDVVKILIFASAVMITCLIVTLGFQAAEAAKNASRTAIARMNEIDEEIKDSGIKVYEGNDIYGSDVVNCIKKLLGNYSQLETAPMYVIVKTASLENTYVNDEFISELRDFSSPLYIKPTGLFKGEIIKNQNKVNVGIKFTQQSGN